MVNWGWVSYFLFLYENDKLKVGCEYFRLKFRQRVLKHRQSIHCYSTRNSWFWIFDFAMPQQRGGKNIPRNGPFSPCRCHRQFKVPIRIHKLGVEQTHCFGYNSVSENRQIKKHFWLNMLRKFWKIIIIYFDIVNRWSIYKPLYENIFGFSKHAFLIFVQISLCIVCTLFFSLLIEKS